MYLHVNLDSYLTLLHSLLRGLTLVLFDRGLPTTPPPPVGPYPLLPLVTYGTGLTRCRHETTDRPLDKRLETENLRLSSGPGCTDLPPLW